MTSAAIYARVSSARQKKDETIASQTAVLRAHERTRDLRKHYRKISATGSCQKQPILTTDGATDGGAIVSGMRRPRRPVVAGPCAEPDRAANVPATVPNLVGLALPAAHDTALDAGLLAVVVDGDGADYAVRDRPAYQVIGQDPEPGRCVPRGHRIGVWVHYRSIDGPGGDAGRGGDGGGGRRRPSGHDP